MNTDKLPGCILKKSRPYRASVRIADLLIMAAVAMFIGFALAVQL